MLLLVVVFAAFALLVYCEIRLPILCGIVIDVGKLFTVQESLKISPKKSFKIARRSHLSSRAVCIYALNSTNANREMKQTQLHSCLTGVKKCFRVFLSHSLNESQEESN
jgi:hypothetical protein